MKPNHVTRSLLCWTWLIAPADLHPPQMCARVSQVFPCVYLGSVAPHIDAILKSLLALGLQTDTFVLQRFHQARHFWWDTKLPLDINKLKDKQNLDGWIVVSVYYAEEAVCFCYLFSTWLKINNIALQESAKLKFALLLFWRPLNSSQSLK